MEKIKKIIILLLIIITIIGIIMISIIIATKKQNNTNTLIEEVEEGDNSTLYQVEKVEDSNIFYSVSYCIERYYNNLVYNEEINNEEDLEDKAKVIYDILYSQYINENAITQANILRKEGLFKNDITFTAIKMEKYTSENYDIFQVEGEVADTETKELLQHKNFIVLLDNNTTAFAIYPTDENLSEQELKKEEETTTEIARNDNNEFIIVTTNYDVLLRRYTAYFQEQLQKDKKKAYDMLDEDYREKRFKNFEDFEKYVTNNQELFDEMTVEKYQITDTEDGYTQYVIQDSSEGIYIIKEKAIMDYQIIWDTYTIDLQEFIDKYNEADDRTKAGMQVERVIEAINRKDYNYIYEHLAESFKNNSYANVAIMQQDLEMKLYYSNNKEYKNYEQQGNLHVFELEISDQKDDAKKQSMTIIVKLEEGTDFVMSFSIE